MTLVLGIATIGVGYRNLGIEIARHHATNDCHYYRYQHTDNNGGSRKQALQRVGDVLLDEVLQPQHNQNGYRQADAYHMQERLTENHLVDILAVSTIATIGGNALGTVHH